MKRIGYGIGAFVAVARQDHDPAIVTCNVDGIHLASIGESFGNNFKFIGGHNGFSSFTARPSGSHEAEYAPVKSNCQHPVAFNFNPEYIAAMDIQEQIRELKRQHKRRQQALAARRAGKTLAEIGTLLGISRQRAQKLVEAAEREAGK